MDEYGKDIFVDTSGNVHVTGYFLDTVDFDPGTGTFELTSASDSYDIFTVALKASSFPWPMFLPAALHKTAP